MTRKGHGSVCSQIPPISLKEQVYTVSFEPEPLSKPNINVNSITQIHYTFYFFMYYDLAHRFVGGFESLMLLSFLFGATHRYEDMGKKSFMHSFSGINNLSLTD